MAAALLGLTPISDYDSDDHDSEDIDDIVLLLQEPVVGQRLKTRIDGVILRSTLDKSSADSEIVAHLPIYTALHVMETFAVDDNRGGRVRVRVKTVEDVEDANGVLRICVGWCTLATSRGSVFLTPSPEEV